MSTGGNSYLAQRHAIYKIWGIPWPNQFNTKRGEEREKEALGIMDNALKIINPVIESLPAPASGAVVPDSEKGHEEIMSEALRDSLILGRDVVRKARQQLQEICDAGIMIRGEDLKVLKWGTDTAAWMTRAAVRVVEEKGRKGRTDIMAGLLAQIEAAKTAGGTKK